MVRRRVRVTLTVRVARLPCRLRQNIAVTNEISDRYTDFVLWQEHGAPLVSMSNHHNTIVKFKAALKTAKKGGSTNQNQMAFAANVYQDVRGGRSRRTFAANVHFWRSPRSERRERCERRERREPKRTLKRTRRSFRVRGVRGELRSFAANAFTGFTTFAAFAANAFFSEKVRLARFTR